MTGVQTCALPILGRLADRRPVGTGPRARRRRRERDHGRDRPHLPGAGAPRAAMSSARAPRGLKFFFQAVTPDEARAALAGFAPVGTERVRVADAADRVLAEDVSAPGDLPHFDRADMDGYAVRAADTFGASQTLPAYLRLAGTIVMGQAVRRSLGKGEAVRISTGGMLPPRADAVVMIEHTEEVGGTQVEVHRSVSPWQHVVRVGDD